MAFAKKFHSTFNSYNGWSYLVEIYQENFSGNSTEFIIGDGGPKIEYETDSDDRYSTILASKLKLPMIIDKSWMIDWVEALRLDLAEQQVYIHLYRGPTSSGRTPIWSGFVLMDLSETIGDEVLPYEVIITATDGIALLKNIDYVEDGATPPYDGPDRFNGKKRFTALIYHAIKQIGIATTTEGAGSNWSWRTSVNWYNSEHPNTNVGSDPLHLTRGNAASFYKRIDEDTSPPVPEYSAPNCYDILKEILKTWGARMVYWNHIIWITQIDGYATTDSGTYAAPDNINTRKYPNTGTSSTGNFDYLGTLYWSPYNVNINPYTTPERLKRLKGRKYSYLPVVKKATASYFSGGTENYFCGFATDYTGAGTAVRQEDIDNIAGASYLLLEFPLSFTHTVGTGAAIDSFTHFDIMIFFQMQLVHGGTTYRLKYKGGGYYNPTLEWETSGYSQFNNDMPKLMFNNIPRGCTGWIEQVSLQLEANSNFTGTASEIDIIVDSELTTVWATNKVGVYYVDSNNPNWMGPYTITTSPTTVGLSWSCVPNPNSSWSMGPSISIPQQSWQGQSTAISVTDYVGGNLQQLPMEGSLLPINASSNVSATNYTQQLATNDSFQFEFGVMKWGDAPNNSDPSALQVWDGSAWVYTPVAGEWGRSTLTGTNTFTDLLLIEYMYGGAVNLKRTSMSIVTAKKTRYRNDGSGLNQPQYYSPITKLGDKSQTTGWDFHLFARGTFFPLEDRWDGEWIQFRRSTVSLSATSRIVLFPNSKVAGTNSISRSPASQKLSSPNFNTQITTTSAAISAGATTSIPINAIGTAIFKTGDTLDLFDTTFTYMNGDDEFVSPITLTLTADQAASDTTLTVSSYTFDNDFPTEAAVRINPKNLISETLHQESGTIAGMPVDADDLGPINYSGGRYTIDADAIVGVDLDYIKILPSDFLANDDNTTYSVAWKDGSGQTGVIPEDGALEMFAFVSIPSGKTATTVDVWGSNAKALNVYEHDVNAGAGMGTAIGTGTVNTELDITDTASTATNYLVIKITTTATSNRIYGGKVTIIDTP